LTFIVLNDLINPKVC